MPPTLLVDDPLATRRRLTGLATSLSLHALGLAVLLALPAASHVLVPPPSLTPPMQITAMPTLPTAPPTSDDRALADERDARDQPETERVTVAGIDIDITKVRARQHDLFPFLTLDLLFLERIQTDVDTAPRRLINPLSAEAHRARRPPLAMTDAALQRTIDLAWSRRQRWTAFAEIAALVSDHDADEGRVPDLLRAYLDQNILQPFCDTSTRDPRFWAMLDNAADHADFIDFVRSFARQHPSSKTTTELLFLLDELVQGSRDVLLMLLDTRPVSDLTRTATSHREAYDLAHTIRQRYSRWLLERGLESSAAITARYDDLRLRLLTTIVETSPGGYRAGDARYLAGEIAFGHDDRAEAERWWLGITPDPRDAFAPAYARVRALVHASSGATDRELRNALRSDYARWRLAAIDRLHHFGHSCDSF